MLDADDLTCHLFAHLPPGHIEVRIIEDKKKGKLIERRWYRSPEDLAQAMDRMNELARAKHAAVFIGVLPRRTGGAGTADDVLPGLACWVDLDFRDFAGGQAEARIHLSSFPLPPSFVVRSGHGLHAYWLMREPTEPAILSSLSRGLARLLGADHAFDAARVLRLPGTWNRKDPTAPILVEIETADPTRTYNPADLEEYLEPLPDERESASGAASSAESIPISDALSPRVVEILSSHPRVRAFFHGSGKLPRTEDGYEPDTSSSGYDYSLVLALAKKGITDESELATALWSRPDGQAREKGVRYIARTVRRALAFLSSQRRKSNQDKEEHMTDFNVERVRIYDSNPPTCELTIDGRPIRLTSKELLYANQVRQRAFDVLRRVIDMPKQADWLTKVNELMAQAEVVEQPPEASQDEFLRDQIRTVIADLRVAEALADLDRAMALLHNGTIIFKTAAIHKGLRENFREVPSGEICAQLHAMGYVWITPKIDGRSVRVWTKAPDPAQAGDGGSAT